MFICGGAFVGLDKIINRRNKSGAVGSGASVISNKDSLGYGDVITKDLIAFGLIPEFIGRFGLITHVDELSVDDLVKILKEPKNSLISQYKYLFSIDGIELEFKDEALKEIAEKSKQLQTNARGLKNILEKVLLQYQFEAMDLVQRGLNKIVISKQAVNGDPAELIFNKTKKKLNYESNS